jgi:hypothetical protein
LDLRLDIIDGVRGFNLKSDGFSCKSLHENLHTIGFRSKSASNMYMSKEDSIHTSNNLIMHEYVNEFVE